MKDIVGWMIDGRIITNDLRAIVMAAKEGRLSDLYTRNQMQFMASCDLGENWVKMANGKTLFYINKKGECVWHEEITPSR